MLPDTPGQCVGATAGRDEGARRSECDGRADCFKSPQNEGREGAPSPRGTILTTLRPGATLNATKTRIGLTSVEPEKNLHASVPPALLTQAEKAARDERITLDELVRDAMERRLNRRELDEVLAFGKRHARARGLKPGDVAGAIAQVRC